MNDSVVGAMMALQLTAANNATQASATNITTVRTCIKPP
jgi:hypothetical protein